MDYKQIELGLMPSDWEVVKLGEVFDILKTYSNSRNDLDIDSDINYIHYGELHTKYTHFIDFDFADLPKIQATKLSNVLNDIVFCQNGDLVMADASEDYEGIVKSVEIKNLKEVVAGLHIFLLRDKQRYFANGFKGYIFYHKFSS